MSAFVLASIVLMCLFTAVFFAEGQLQQCVITLMIAIVLSLWFAFSANQPWMYHPSQSIKTFELDHSTYAIVYNSYREKYILVNLTEKCGINIPVDETLEIKQGKSGWYAGIHWPSSTYFVLIIDGKEYPIYARM